MADTDAESSPPADNTPPSQPEHGEGFSSRREALKVQLSNLQTRLTLLSHDVRGIACRLRRLGAEEG
jgi:hypothetical protein